MQRMRQCNLCGRFTLTSSAQLLAKTFETAEEPQLAARYNIAPSQEILAIRADATGGREWAELRWGLIPPWTKDPKAFRPFINARSETAASKPSFRRAFAKRRCLVPASGFYEWQGKRGDKKPFLFRRADVSLFAIAGIFENWRGEGGEIVESVALLTTAANVSVRPIHDRMPVILSADQWPVWLDPEIREAGPLEDFLVPGPESDLEVTAVSARVNNPRFDAPECLEAV